MHDETIVLDVEQVQLQGSIPVVGLEMLKLLLVYGVESSCLLQFPLQCYDAGSEYP
jgi:hypothetical protein